METNIDLLKFDFNKGLSFWGDLASLIYNPLGGAIGGLFLDDDFFEAGFLGLIPGHSRYEVRFEAKSLSYGTDQIYEGLVRYHKKILWTFNSQKTITHIRKNQPPDILPFDSYGGGYYPLTDISEAIDNDDVTVADKFSFIPTASALDIGGGTATLNDYDYTNEYTGAYPPSSPKNTPFDNFITSFISGSNPDNNNQPHISFQTRNGNWLAKELEADPSDQNYPPQADCSFICSSELNGPDVLCYSNSVYSVPEGVSYYQWSITHGSAQINSGQGTHEITLTGQGAGEINLKVVFGTQTCGYTTLTKTIPTGLLLFDSLETVGNQSEYNPTEQNISIELGGIACNQILLKVNFNSSAPILEYKWKKITTDVRWSLSSTSSASTTSSYFSLYPRCNKDFTFQVKARNACGWTAWKTISYPMHRCTGDCPPSNGGAVVGTNFILTPNPVPSDGQLIVSVKDGAPLFTHSPIICETCPDPTEGGSDPEDVTNFNPTVNIEIFNLSGIAVLSSPNSVLPITIDISSFPSGTYLVKTQNSGGLLESHTIIKQ